MPMSLHRLPTVFTGFVAGLLVTFAVLAGAEAAGMNLTSQFLEVGQRLAGPPPMAIGLYQAPPGSFPLPNQVSHPIIAKSISSGSW